MLVTNDDGVASPGLVALVRAVMAPGRRVVVAAPASDQSGTSAAVAPRPADGVRIAPVSLAGLGGADDVIAFSVDGPPALAVLGARVGEFGRPAAEATVVASGINLGANTGLAVLFSGTVGAAMAAANLGLSALAVSIDSDRPSHLATATAVAASALEWVLAAPAGTVLNVNVPDLALDQLAGFRHAPLGTAIATFQPTIHERDAGPYVARFQIKSHEPAPGTDGALLRDGWVTLTALTGISADTRLDAAAFLERAIGEAA